MEKSKKKKKPVILCVIHHRQNPSEPTQDWLSALIYIQAFVTNDWESVTNFKSGYSVSYIDILLFILFYFTLFYLYYSLFNEAVNRPHCKTSNGIVIRE
jgi:hypothetical protein